MFQERQIKEFNYNPEGDFIFSELLLYDVGTGCASFNQDEIRMGVVKAFLSTGLGEAADNEAFEGLRAILCEEKTPWKIIGIRPLPGELTIRIEHLWVKRLQNVGAYALVEDEMREAKRVIEIFDVGIVDIRLSHKSEFGHLICRFFLSMDESSTVEFRVEQDKTIINARPKGALTALENIGYTLTWSNAEHTKFRAETVRRFGI